MSLEKMRAELEKSLGNKKEKKVVVSLSGGLDSTVLVHMLVDTFGKDNVICVSFDYAQRHEIELTLAKRSTQKLGVTHKILDMSFLHDIVKGVSSMVKGDVAMAEADENDMPSSYVPFRNALFSMVVASVAEAEGANYIALGLNMDQPDDDIQYRYWDITPEFYNAIENLLKLNTTHKLEFLAPFTEMDKTEEILIGKELGVDFRETWTCYSPQVLSSTGTDKKTYIPCRNCPSCKERIAAFEKAGFSDPCLLGVHI